MFLFKFLQGNFLVTSIRCGPPIRGPHIWLKENVFIHRNHKSQQISTGNTKQYAYLSVTYRHNDNYTDIYDGKMANCCQKVRGNKTNQRRKQQQKQINKQKTNKQTNNNNKKREEGGAR